MLDRGDKRVFRHYHQIVKIVLLCQASMSLLMLFFHRTLSLLWGWVLDGNKPDHSGFDWRHGKFDVLA